MKKQNFILFYFFLNLALLHGQNPVLESYIAEGMASNSALKQRQLDYTKSLLALKEAKGLFFPEVSVNARYTLADGGRVISFPVGDLLNPVYNTLNMLTASNQFPEIENEEFNFYRAKEHETKVSLIQPIYNSDIIHNVRIKSDLSEISRISVDQYKRELIMEIKSSYYTFQKAWYLNALIDSTLLLVKENLRVSNSLYKNDLLTVDAVYRSEAEVGSVLAEKAKAQSMLIGSRAYFNFLLNRPLDSAIELFSEDPGPIIDSPAVFQEEAVANREEIGMVRKTMEVNGHVAAMQQGAATPDLFAAIDYGYQGEEFTFTQDDDFILASLVFRWTLFQGMANRNKVKQTKIEAEKLKELLSEAEQKIKMQVLTNYYEAMAALEALEAAQKRVTSAKRAFRLIERKYAEGQASLLEFIDARTSFTNAGSNMIIALNDYFIRLAQLEYAAGEIDINQF